MNAVASPLCSIPRLKRRSKAFGLLEVILVFAIVIGAAAAVFTVFGFANASSEANAIVDQTNLVAANLRASPWGVAHNFSDIPADMPGQWVPGIFPNSWRAENGQAVSPETGATAYFGGGTPGGFAPNQFWVVINFVPVNHSECERVGSELAAEGYDDVWFAGSGPADIGQSVCASTTPCRVDMGKLTTWCTGTQAADSPGTVGFQVLGH